MISQRSEHRRGNRLLNRHQDPASMEAQKNAFSHRKVSASVTDRTSMRVIIRLVASKIDARQFNRSFPQVFPRFVQLAVWRYCSQQGFDVCNGNRLDDRHRCENRHCRLYGICDRIRLK